MEKNNDLELFRSLVENANVFMYKLSLEGMFTYISPSFIDVYKNSDKLIGQHFSVLVHKNDVKRCMEFMENVFQTKEKQEGLRYRIKDLDGNYQWHMTKASPVLEKGEVVAFVGVATDIMPYVKLERDLKRSRAKYLELVELSADWIWEIDVNGKYTYSSSHVQDLLAYLPEEVIGKTPFDFMASKEEIEKNRLLFSEIVKKKEIFRSLENWNLTKDGRLICLLTSGVPIFNENGDFLGYRGIDVDITKQKEAEQAVLQTARLSAIGELASAVAHDFNNVLQGIAGYSDLALLENISDKLREYIQLINQFANDAAARVRQMQRFAGHNENQDIYSIISVNDVLDDAIVQTRALWKIDAEKEGITISIKKDCQSDLFILGSFTELRTVLYNIIKNAVQSMPDGGVLSFKTSRNKDGQICLCCSDTGSGMSEETKQKIFDPFYSTKSNADGRGLGMSGAYFVIKEHRGKISVKNTNLNKGSTIEILLPYVNELVIDHEKKLCESIDELNILWVDDEKMIRNFLKKIFQKIPCNLTLVTSGAEAICSLSEKEYDLLVTDIGMPDMSGWQLLDKIRGVYPEMKLAIATGWGSTISLEKKGRYNLGYILSKPFSIEEVKNLLRELSQLNQV